MKTIVILLVLLCASLTHAQDPMAKWKPRVGDRFYYRRHIYSMNANFNQDTTKLSSDDTLLIEIIKIDSNHDSAHQGLVVVHNLAYSNADSGNAFYYFHSSADSLADHSFVIEQISYNQSDNPHHYAKFDFSQSIDSFFWIQARGITAYGAYWFYENGLPGKFDEYKSAEAFYAPDMQWFVQQSSYSYENVYQSWSSSKTDSKLISSTALNVPSSKSELNTGIRFSGTMLIVDAMPDRLSCLNLLDPLGRSIRSWQLAASDGAREITLNVADVPSGVYFLRLQGGGMDEVRKVLIR